MRARRYCDLSILISILSPDCCSPEQGRNARPHAEAGPPAEVVLSPADLLGGEDGVDSLAGDRQGRLADLQAEPDVRTQTFSQSQIRAFISIENDKQVDN